MYKGASKKISVPETTAEEVSNHIHAFAFERTVAVSPVLVVTICEARRLSIWTENDGRKERTENEAVPINGSGSEVMGYKPLDPTKLS